MPPSLKSLKFGVTTFKFTSLDPEERVFQCLSVSLLPFGRSRDTTVCP